MDEAAHMRLAYIKQKEEVRTFARNKYQQIQMRRKRNDLKLEDLKLEDLMLEKKAFLALKCEILTQKDQRYQEHLRKMENR